MTENQFTEKKLLRQSTQRAGADPQATGSRNSEGSREY
jgi:hypothetical protein